MLLDTKTLTCVGKKMMPLQIKMFIHGLPRLKNSYLIIIVIKINVFYFYVQPNVGLAGPLNGSSMRKNIKVLMSIQRLTHTAGSPYAEYETCVCVCERERESKGVRVFMLTDQSRPIENSS